jgi:hypothetical protein
MRTRTLGALEVSARGPGRMGVCASLPTCTAAAPTKS